MSEEKILEEAVKLVEEAKKPGTFNIISVLNERAYPREEVKIFLDEQSAYEASKLKEKIDELVAKNDSELQEEIDSIIAKQEMIVKKLRDSEYTFNIVGISEGMREDLQEESIKKFPLEFEEDKNPFTGEISKREVESKERDRYFTNLLWHSSIEKIVSPEGDVQDKISISDVESFRKNLPIAGIGAITQSIEKLRVATAMFMISVDEDFLAKS